MINERILTGFSVRKIAEEFDVDRMAVQRHREGHLPRDMVKSKQLQEMEQADKLLERVEGLYDKALDLMAKAEADGKFQPAVSAIKEARSNLELIARLVGELKTGTHINLTYSPQYVELRQILVNTLEPFPEVRDKVVKALDCAEQTEVIDT